MKVIRQNSPIDYLICLILTFIVFGALLLLATIVYWKEDRHETRKAVNRSRKSSAKKPRIKPKGFLKGKKDSWGLRICTSFYRQNASYEEVN